MKKTPRVISKSVPREADEVPRPAGRTRSSPASRASAQPVARPESRPVVRQALVETLAESPAWPMRRRARFGYFNPDAREVFLVGTFNNWNLRETPLRRESLGDWSVELELSPGEYRYRFHVDGEWKDDPTVSTKAPNPYGGYDMVIDI